ncbi:MAG: glycosyltransferase family 2 protein [Muribaculaceae bacterium]|nr:glycosyltransferase family 2 protein [Muribaculaceae bacterium]
MSQPKVSVIVPVYNSGIYVERCLNSVQNQTYKNTETIFVNDGSTDNSGKIIDEIAASIPNVTALHQENQGPAAARRAGALKATGTYIMFLDSDDTLPLDAIEYMVNTSMLENLDAFYGTYNRVIDNKVFAMPPRDFEGVVTGDEMLKNSIDPHFNYHAAICFSKHELWDGDMFCNDRNLPSEDVLTNVNLILRCKRVGIYNKPIYNYHLVGTSLTMTGQYFNQTCFKNFFNQLKTILKENSKEELMKDYVRMKEITSFGFLIKDIDTSDDWYKQVMAYDVNDYPRKIWLLHKLLHFPRLLKTLVGINRWQKRLLNF